MNGHSNAIPNYIRILNWAWESLPFIDGCKASHVVLFLAVVDSINRNRWSKTSIPYDYLVNKCKISKQVYLDARKWLIDHKLLQIEFGRNGFQMATFELGVAVRNLTAIDTSTNVVPVENPTATRTGNHTPTHDIPVRNLTATRTHSKTVNIENSKTLNIPFEQFWDLYDKKTGKEKCPGLWVKLTDEERQKAIDHIPAYIAANPEKRFRKDPERYLKYKTFNDEIIFDGKDTNNKTLEPVSTDQRVWP